MSALETRALSALLARARSEESWVVLDASDALPVSIESVDVARAGLSASTRTSTHPRLLIQADDLLSLMLLAYPGVEVPTKQRQTVAVIVDDQVSDERAARLLAPGQTRETRYPVLLRLDSLPALAQWPDIRVVGAGTTLFEALAPCDVVLTASPELACFANAMLKPALLVGDIDRYQDPMPFIFPTSDSEAAATLESLEASRLTAELFNWKRDIVGDLPGRLDEAFERLGV